MGCCSSQEVSERKLVVARIKSSDNSIEVLALNDKVEVFDTTATESCCVREIAEISIDERVRPPVIIPSLLPKNVLPMINQVQQQQQQQQQNKSSATTSSSQRKNLAVEAANTVEDAENSPSRAVVVNLDTADEEDDENTNINEDDENNNNASRQVLHSSPTTFPHHDNKHHHHFEAQYSKLRVASKIIGLASSVNSSTHGHGGTFGEALQAQWTAISHDGKTLASSDNKGRISIFDIYSGKRLGDPIRIHVPGDITNSLSAKIIDTIVFSKHDRYLYGCCSWNDGVNRPIYVIDVRAGKQLCSFPHNHKSSVYRLVLSPTFENVHGETHQLLATLANDYTIGVWRLRNKEICQLDMEDIEEEKQRLSEEAFEKLQQERKMSKAEARKTHSCPGCSFTKPEFLTFLGGEAGCATEIAFLNSNVLLSLSHDRELRWWDIGRAKETRSPLRTGHIYSAHCLAVSPDGKLIATGSQDKQILLFDAQNWKKIQTPKPFKGHAGRITSIAFAPTDSQPPIIASAGAGGTVRMWNALTGDCIQTIETNRILISAVFGPNCQNLAITMEFPPRVKVFSFVIGRYLPNSSYSCRRSLAQQMLYSSTKEMEQQQEQNNNNSAKTKEVRPTRIFEDTLIAKVKLDEFEGKLFIQDVKTAREKSNQLLRLATGGGGDSDSNNEDYNIVIPLAKMRLDREAEKVKANIRKRAEEGIQAAASAAALKAKQQQQQQSSLIDDNNNKSNNNKRNRGNSSHKSNNSSKQHYRQESSNPVNNNDDDNDNTEENNGENRPRSRRMSVLGGDAAAAASALAARRRFEEEEAAALQAVMKQKQEEFAREETRRMQLEFEQNMRAANDATDVMDDHSSADDDDKEANKKNDDDDDDNDSSSGGEENDEEGENDENGKTVAEIDKNNKTSTCKNAPDTTEEEDEDAKARKKYADTKFLPEGTTGPPSAGVFSKFGGVVLDFEESIRKALSIRKTPVGREEDLKHLVHETEEETENAVAKLMTHINEVAMIEFTKRAEMLEIVENCKLTQDDLRVLYLFNIGIIEGTAETRREEEISYDETLFPFGKWINAWFHSIRRDATFKNHIGPIYTLFNRAVKKLPTIRWRQGAARAFVVDRNPFLYMTTYEHHVERLKKGRVLCFWGMTSFTTDQKTILSEHFLGSEKEESVIYSLTSTLVGVDLSPFTLARTAEFRLRKKQLFLHTPAVFEVVNVKLVGDVKCKLSVVLNQIVTEDFSYCK